MMITLATEKRIIAECRHLCETLGLDKVYLAETVGPRRHYLAGYGDTVLEQASQIQLTYRIAVLWYGVLHREQEAFFFRSLCALTEQVERELEEGVSSIQQAADCRNQKES